VTRADEEHVTRADEEHVTRADEEHAENGYDAARTYALLSPRRVRTNNAQRRKRFSRDRRP
jgi:hypothetical protein